MKKKFLILACGLLMIFSGCSKKSCCTNKCNNRKTCSIKTDSSMEANNAKETLACTLTNVEMKERMKTLEKFKSIIKEKKEIENGMVFQFEGNNKNLEEILDLMKLERQCCSFLTFDLKVQKEAKPIHLTISGPEGTKDFLSYELGL